MLNKVKAQEEEAARLKALEEGVDLPDEPEEEKKDE